MLNKMKLAPKLAIIIGGVLTVTFTALIVMTAMLSQTAIHSAVSGELTAMSSSNAAQIQQIIDAAKNAAMSMEKYLEKAYVTAEEDPQQMVIPIVPEAAAMCQSSIYNKTLSALNYDVEVFLKETARNTAVNNEDLVGVGVMFEPYKFQDDIRDYSFYVEEKNTDGDIEPYGTYEDYASEIFYKDAAAQKKAIVTEPYEFNGIEMLSYATPVIYKDEVQGVIMTDINVTNFEKVKATSEAYPSMYATIYDDKGVIIYDSEDAADIGKHLKDFTPNQKDLTAIQNGMAQGQPFSIETTRETGVKVTRFFAPIQAASATWWSQTALFTSDMNESVRNTIVWLAILSVTALLLLMVLTVSVLKKCSAQCRAL